MIKMMEAKHKANLLTLKNFIKSVDPSNFDMGVYCTKEGENLGVDQAINQHTCGSSMCLIGWTSAVPSLLDYARKMFEEDENQLEWVTFEKLDWYDIATYLFGTDDGDDEGIGQYLFSASWAHNEETNTIEHALYRIDRVLQATTQEDYMELAREYEEELNEPYS